MPAKARMGEKPICVTLCAMAHDGPAEFAKPTRPGELTPYLRTLLKGGTLSEAAARAAFEEIASGESHHAEVGAFLALLATRMPTVDEIVGAATVMRAHVERVPCKTPANEIVDTAGTGGAPKSFNVSTLAAVVAAGAGAKDVLKVTVYIVGPENWAAFNAVYAEVFGEHRPARTVLPVSELYFGYLVEVEAVAAAN